MGIVLQTFGLSKRYGKVVALKALDLKVEEGMVFGFLGPNGSGKTTTLGLVLDVLQPSSGYFEWFGQPASTNMRKDIGAILETPCFYPYMTGLQNLRVVAGIKECGTDDIDDVLKLVDLYDRRDDKFKTYSLGMKQRLAIASALISDPEVLILDEPTNGLDPQGIVEIRNLIRKIASMGKTIILASHLLDEVQKVCTHFMVLRKGEKLFQGEVQVALSDKVHIEVSAEDLASLKKILYQHDRVLEIEEVENMLVLSSNDVTTLEVNSYAMEQGITLSLLRERPGSLEEQFLKILSEND